MLLLFEKTVLHYIAIKFHQTALADRLVENRLALRALDHLSTATPTPLPRKSPYRKGGKGSSGSAFDLWSSGVTPKSGDRPDSRAGSPPDGRKPRKQGKNVAGVIVDQVCLNPFLILAQNVTRLL